MRGYHRVAVPVHGGPGKFDRTTESRLARRRQQGVDAAKRRSHHTYARRVDARQRGCEIEGSQHIVAFAIQAPDQLGVVFGAERGRAALREPGRPGRKTVAAAVRKKARNAPGVEQYRDAWRRIVLMPLHHPAAMVVEHARERPVARRQVQEALEAALATGERVLHRCVAERGYIDIAHPAARPCNPLLEQAFKTVQGVAHARPHGFEVRARGTRIEVGLVRLLRRKSAFPGHVGPVGAGVGLDPYRAGRQTHRHPHIAGITARRKRCITLARLGVVMGTFDDHVSCSMAGR